MVHLQNTRINRWVTACFIIVWGIFRLVVKYIQFFFKHLILKEKILFQPLKPYPHSLIENHIYQRFLPQWCLRAFLGLINAALSAFLGLIYDVLSAFLDLIYQLGDFDKRGLREMGVAQKWVIFLTISPSKLIGHLPLTSYSEWSILLVITLKGTSTPTEESL